MATVLLSSKHVPPLSVGEPPPPALKEKQSLVTSIALKCLKEFAVSLAIGAIVSFFVSPGSLVLIFGACLVQLAVNAIFHALGAYAESKGCPTLQWICQFITGASFGVLTGYNAQTLIHECGHASAASLVYKNPRPLIQIFPFIGGFTEFNKAGLSAIGKWLGASSSTLLVVASGPALTLLVSAVILAIGISMRETNPDLSKYLIGWALVDFCNHAFYAYTALEQDPWHLAHDFVHLSIFGLDPMTAAVGILAIPVIVTLGMFCFSKKPPEKQAASQALS